MIRGLLLAFSIIISTIFWCPSCTSFVFPDYSCSSRQTYQRHGYGTQNRHKLLNDHTQLSLQINDISSSLATAAADVDQGLSKTTTVLIFLAGVFPFAWATIEFWRRIAFGEPFGTGSDSVVIIGEENAPESSRGRRVLGKGALTVAYALFAISAFVLAIALYAVISPTDQFASPSNQ